MASDLFSGFGALGGFMDGIAKSGLIPKDTPEGKVLNAVSDVSSLEKQEAELLTEIGREAYRENPTRWAQDSKLRLIQQNLADARKVLEDAQSEQKEADAAKEAIDARGRCSNCGHKNEDGIHFCQNCGTPLGAPAKKHCTSCGTELVAGIRFCGSCGAQQAG